MKISNFPSRGVSKEFRSDYLPRPGGLDLLPPLDTSVCRGWVVRGSYGHFLSLTEGMSRDRTGPTDLEPTTG